MPNLLHGKIVVVVETMGLEIRTRRVGMTAWHGENGFSVGIVECSLPSVYGMIATSLAACPFKLGSEPIRIATSPNVAI
jgi:hypothetical protein